jgi:hypothetical protein
VISLKVIAEIDKPLLQNSFYFELKLKTYTKMKWRDNVSLPTATIGAAAPEVTPSRRNDDYRIKKLLPVMPRKSPETGCIVKRMFFMVRLRIESIHVWFSILNISTLPE